MPVRPQTLGNEPRSAHRFQPMGHKRELMAKTYSIGPFRLDPDSHVVTRRGVPEPLGPRAVGRSQRRSSARAGPPFSRPRHPSKRGRVSWSRTTT
jgi:hypothetical protein